MQPIKNGFDVKEAIQHIKHYLPAQAPLKDFIHHNTLHAFQNKPFHAGIQTASERFGYKVYLRLDEYRNLLQSGKISEQALQDAILAHNGPADSERIRQRLLHEACDNNLQTSIGHLRAQWKQQFRFNPDKITHPLLFRILNNYLDQGISINGFPLVHNGFLNSMREIESKSFVSIFKTKGAKALLMDAETTVESLLDRIVGKPDRYEQYLFDQQFAHPGWSGMVSVLEDNNGLLLDRRAISLNELILFELLLELDAIEARLGEDWTPLGLQLDDSVPGLFETQTHNPLWELLKIWHEAYEWTYYTPVLNGLRHTSRAAVATEQASVHALFCIDDRECSFRRHIELLDKQAMTYGTPGFFNVEFHFRPEHSRFHTKVCPAPMPAGHIIVETETKQKNDKDAHFTKNTHSLISGWLISQTLGFWSAMKLFMNIFRPTLGPATAYSFRHMDGQAKLSIEHHGEAPVDGLQVGFTVNEMAERMKSLFKGIGLTRMDTPVVYFVGHGASSSNNTHYAGYDCGACSGRPGSVNARVAAYMCNHPGVRQLLSEQGIQIGKHTRFIGALHDTTRDEIGFFDTELLDSAQKSAHAAHEAVFMQALERNAKERSRKFILTNTRQSSAKVHEQVKRRSVSLFEPRPELNHATNTLCIVGRRSMSRGLFLDRRAFLNSYDYRTDRDGNALLNILKAVAPVCGGINLEYYFSRTDNDKLGAGSKLPHNVMGLIGVANGTDGDLRTGLPLQMVEVHDPMRLLVVVENKPAMVLDVIQRSPQTFEWFKNGWIHLVALDPETLIYHRLSGDHFTPLNVNEQAVESCSDLMKRIESTDLNLPVFVMEEQFA